MIAFYMNIILSVIWLMLKKEPTVTDLFIGYIIGFILIIPFSKLLNGQSYIRRVLKFIRFFTVFLYEFIISNLSVAYMILFVPKSQIKPIFFDFDIKGLSWFETILLTYCITLTPGTISVQVIKEEDNLIVHCLDSRDPESTKLTIDQVFKRNILGFTR